MSALQGRGTRRTAILAALATSAAIAVPAYASEGPPHQGDDGPAPGFRVLTEVQNPANGTYVDGDADAFSRGDNDGFRPTLRVGDTAHYKVWVVNTGDVDLFDLRVTAPDCNLDHTIAHLPAGDPDPYVRLSCSRVITAPPEICTVATAANPRVPDGQREEEYVFEDEQSERACVIVETPSSEEPPPAPKPPAPAPEPEPEVADPAPAPVVVTTPRRARLAISKAGKARVRAGERTYWHMRVRSTGNTTARKVVLRDRIPNGFSVVRAKIRVKTKVRGKMVNRWRPVKYTVRRGNLTVKLGAIGRGKTKHVRVWMRAAKNARGTRVNIATADGSNTRPVRDRAKITILPGKRIQIAPAVTG